MSPGGDGRPTEEGTGLVHRGQSGAVPGGHGPASPSARAAGKDRDQEGLGVGVTAGWAVLPASVRGRRREKQAGQRPAWRQEARLGPVTHRATPGDLSPGPRLLPVQTAREARGLLGLTSMDLNLGMKRGRPGRGQGRAGAGEAGPLGTLPGRHVGRHQGQLGRPRGCCIGRSAATASATQLLGAGTLHTHRGG